MKCANNRCTNYFTPKKADHIYCSTNCGQAARKTSSGDVDRSRFHDAPEFPVPTAERQALANQYSDDVLTAEIIRRCGPSRAAFVRFGCPKNERDLEGDFSLRWFPTRSFTELATLKFPGVALPKACSYVIAYFDADFRLVEPWKYRIYIDWFQPNLPWYLGDRTVGLRR